MHRGEKWKRSWVSCALIIIAIVCFFFVSSLFFFPDIKNLISLLPHPNNQRNNVSVESMYTMAECLAAFRCACVWGNWSRVSKKSKVMNSFGFN